MNEQETQLDVEALNTGSLFTGTEPKADPADDAPETLADATIDDQTDATAEIDAKDDGDSEVPAKEETSADVADGFLDDADENSEAPAEPAEEETPAIVAVEPLDDTSDEGLFDDEDDGEDESDDEEEDNTPHFMQNRELSWLTFNERVLDQGADESVPLLERLNFISIFWSNLQEFFMVRVGSLTDLSYIKPPVLDSKTDMTPKEQIRAIHDRCAELYPIQESYYEHVRGSLAKEGVRHLRPEDLSEEQHNYLSGLVKHNIEPFLSPQIINSRHPFPHLENGKLYIVVRLDDEFDVKRKKKKDKAGKTDKKDKGAEGVVLGLIPLPHQVDRLIKLPGRGYQFILLEHAIEMFAEDIFSMYKVKHTNVICVTRNADLDANQGDDSSDEDYREHMRRLLKQRARLAPVRLECERELSPVLEKLLLKRLGLKRYQVYDTSVPLDLSFTWGLGSKLTEKKRAKLSNTPFSPAWPTCFDRTRRIIDQVQEKEVLLSYPYESMDPFVQLLREASVDPTVISIKITLYRLASQSHLAEALIAAAENGKEVTALFELRARFDEFNNIEWSQRFEQAGCNVIYGFRDYKVHSKICCITRQTEHGIQHITQLGTGNYNEKTAKLYTDLSFITTSEAFGRDAVEFFKNMQLENTSDNYDVLRVAPLQIKPTLLEFVDREIEKARAGKPCGIFMKANSITDNDVIEKLAEASQAGVKITLFIRGICCIIPGLKNATENVRVVSIVGRLLEHSRIYCFGVDDDCHVFLSSADLMTRNLNKRIEIAWPVYNAEIRKRIVDYLHTCMEDTAKLRQLRPNLTYTPLGSFCDVDEEGNPLPAFDSQNALIERMAEAARKAANEEAAKLAEAESAKLAADAVAEVAETIEKDEVAEAVEEAAEAAPEAESVEEIAETVAAIDSAEEFVEAATPIDSADEPAEVVLEADSVEEADDAVESVAIMEEAIESPLDEEIAESVPEEPVESLADMTVEEIMDDTVFEPVEASEPLASSEEAIEEPLAPEGEAAQEEPAAPEFETTLEEAPATTEDDIANEEAPAALESETPPEAVPATPETETVPEEALIAPESEPAPDEAPTVAEDESAPAETPAASVAEAAPAEGAEPQSEAAPEQAPPAKKRGFFARLFNWD